MLPKITVSYHFHLQTITLEENPVTTNFITTHSLDRNSYIPSTSNSLDRTDLKILHNSTNYKNHKDDSSSSSSSSASTTTRESTQNLEYTLVRTPSLRRKHRKEMKPSEGVKKDTYSDGVIIYATVCIITVYSRTSMARTPLVP